MCTGISLKANEGNQYLGRTQEYNIAYDYVVCQFPRGFVADQGLVSWTTDYTVLGLAVKYGQEVGHGILDGVNEHGLAATTQYFADLYQYSTVREITQAGKVPIVAEQFIFWLLSTCKTIEDVIVALQKVAIADLSVEREKGGLPQHFMIKEASGRTIVVEPSEKLAFEVYENTVGVMTNSPKYDWHVTNLQCYSGLKEVSYPELKTAALSERRAGLETIPGDYSSASRFLRAAYLLQLSDEVPSKESINRAFHILSTSDIVEGTITKEAEQNGTAHCTQYMSVYDQTEQQLYVKVYDNFTIQRVKLDKTLRELTIYEIAKEPYYQELV